MRKPASRWSGERLCQSGAPDAASGIGSSQWSRIEPSRRNAALDWEADYAEPGKLTEWVRRRGRGRPLGKATVTRRGRYAVRRANQWDGYGARWAAG